MQGNKVVRQFGHHAGRFVRVRFVSEDLSKDFYFNDDHKFLLGHLHSVMKYGFSFPGCLDFKFIGYSSS